jgi:hypothetical protein
MERLNLAKNRLKKAISKLESVIEKKVGELERENSLLRTEVIKLKQESKKHEVEQSQTAKKKPAKLAEAPQLVNEDTTNQIDLSLSELKKLVGQN